MKRLALSLTALVPFLVACEQPNHLEGSIGGNVSLEFDSTRMIRYQPSLDVQLEYLKALESGGEDVVAKIVFTTPEGGIAAGEEIDLVESDGVVQRVVAAGDQFPPMERGAITFDEGGNEPGPAKGGFAVTFDNGRTLNGRFDVEMEDVEL